MAYIGFIDSIGTPLVPSIRNAQLAHNIVLADGGSKKTAKAAYDRAYNVSRLLSYMDRIREGDRIAQKAAEQAMAKAEAKEQETQAVVENVLTNILGKLGVEMSARPGKSKNALHGRG